MAETKKDVDPEVQAFLDALQAGEIDMQTLHLMRGANERQLRGPIFPERKAELTRQNRHISEALMRAHGLIAQQTMRRRMAELGPDFKRPTTREWLAAVLGLQDNPQRDIGRAQIAQARENPVQAPNFQRLSNEDRMKLSRAGVRNLIGLPERPMTSPQQQGSELLQQAALQKRQEMLQQAQDKQALVQGLQGSTAPATPGMVNKLTQGRDNRMFLAKLMQRLAAQNGGN